MLSRQKNESLDKKINTPSIEIPITKKDSCISNLSDFLNKKSVKCMIYIDGDCGSCLMNLPAIISFMNKLSNIEYVILASTSSSKTFKAFCELHYLEMNVIYDNIDIFYSSNNISKTNFLLLSPSNKIITQDNPIINSKIRKIYKKINQEISQ